MPRNSGSCSNWYSVNRRRHCGSRATAHRINASATRTERIDNSTNRGKRALSQRCIARRRFVDCLL